MLQKKDKYAEIKTLIKKIYHRHKGRFGYRRITMAIRQNGIIINQPEFGIRNEIKFAMKSNNSYI